MARLVYNNNDVDITIDHIDSEESKVNVNGKNLIWISRSEEEEFKRELCTLLDKYRI